MKIKCYNKKCGHERDYKGQFTEDNSLITCTKCRHKLRLGKAKIDGEVALPHEVTSREVGLKSEVTSLPHAELKEDGPQKEKTFTNLSDFNLENHKRGNDNFIKIKEIKNNLNIKNIPRDSVKLLKHHEEYGLNIANV